MIEQVGEPPCAWQWQVTPCTADVRPCGGTVQKPVVQTLVSPVVAAKSWMSASSEHNGFCDRPDKTNKHVGYRLGEGRSQR